MTIRNPKFADFLNRVATRQDNGGKPATPEELAIIAKLSATPLERLFPALIDQEPLPSADDQRTALERLEAALADIVRALRRPTRIMFRRNADGLITEALPRYD